jgi:hypothetical protein
METNTIGNDVALSPAVLPAVPDLLEAAQEALWALDPYAALMERGMWDKEDTARAITKLRLAIARVADAAIA